MATEVEIVLEVSDVVHAFKREASARNKWPKGTGVDRDLVALIVEVHKIEGFSAACVIDPLGNIKHVLKYTDIGDSTWMVDFLAEWYEGISNPILLGSLTSSTATIDSLKVIVETQADWQAGKIWKKVVDKAQQTSCNAARGAAKLSIINSKVYGDSVLPGYLPSTEMPDAAAEAAAKAEAAKQDAAAGCTTPCPAQYKCSGGKCVFVGGPLGSGGEENQFANIPDGGEIGKTGIFMPKVDFSAFGLVAVPGGPAAPPAAAPAATGPCAKKPLDPISQCYKTCTDGAKTHLCGCKTKIEEFEKLMEDQGCDLRCSAKSRAKSCARRGGSRTCAKHKKSGCSVCG